MEDAIMEFLRKTMIDRALELRDKDAFYRLTGAGWQSYLISQDEEDTNEPLGFLAEDPHFWDRRVIELPSRRTYLNYRFRDYISGLLYVGEIRVPMGWRGDVESKFRPRPNDAPLTAPPSWFDNLVKKVTHSLNRMA